ncbi:MAG: redox-sensing transcriptional repressor Rex [Thermomicrobiales bacterium]|nr:redox-sensing transcriptional repressor Rex [Thermomicrobiales bacterium]
MATKSGYLFGSTSQSDPARAAKRPSHEAADPAHPDDPVIPDIVIRRLPIYLRALDSFIIHGIASVNSEELASAIGVTAAQIRRDLSYFGRFGKQGKGYDIQLLTGEIHRILRLDRSWSVALVGYGNLGQAIVHYGGFVPTTFSIDAIFDRNETVGQVVNGITVHDSADITPVVSELGIRIGIIAVPEVSAQKIADQLVAGGVSAILTYAPIVIKAPDHVTVREVDPIGAMQSMTYYIEE